MTSDFPLAKSYHNDNNGKNDPNREGQESSASNSQVGYTKPPHILGTSANLLSICFLLQTGLRISDLHIKTYADEICFLASFVFLSSCFLSYLSIRGSRRSNAYENWADYFFLTGITLLFAAMCMLVAGW